MSARMLHTHCTHTTFSEIPQPPFAKRVDDDLLSPFTLDEKVGSLDQFTPAVERLGVDGVHVLRWMG